MFNITIKDTYDEVSAEAFKIMKEVLSGDHTPVLGLATGSSPVGLYKEMIRDHEENGTSYKDIITFNLDEYDFSDPSERIPNFPTDAEFFGVWDYNISSD